MAYSPTHIPYGRGSMLYGYTEKWWDEAISMYAVLHPDQDVPYVTGGDLFRQWHDAFSDRKNGGMQWARSVMEFWESNPNKASMYLDTKQ